LEHPGDGTNRLFVVEQSGIIYVFDNEPSVSEKSVFLDIQGMVDASGFEEGLLGLAFHPDYENNGYFFVDYTADTPERSVISRFEVSDTNPDSADATSEFVILELDQPFDNHNGGQISFGPDGYLWISFGDGGAGGDPGGNGQDRTTLLGSIIRIDVDTTQSGNNYGIPPDNPFVGNVMGYREEIYAYGLRNAWRFSFDTPTGRVWAGDVGQNEYEEVDLIESGKNYGWNIMEGFHCYNSVMCDTTGLTLPVWEYDHSDSGGSSITGGFVYRGPCVPEIYGKYVYGDFISGRIWALEYDGSQVVSNTELVDTTLDISSFGIDAGNELYVCTFDGDIYRCSCATGVGDETRHGSSDEFMLGPNYPNPFESGTIMELSLTEKAEVEIDVFDLQGRLVKELANDNLSAGIHRFRWDGKDNRGQRQTAGMYFFRIRSGQDAVESRQMVLLR
jgi:hypothetical protein